MTGEQITTLSLFLKVKMLNNNELFYCNHEKLTILQLTDLHLFEKENFLHGVNTNRNFDKVIKDIKNNINTEYDLIILTGDISQDMSEESYNLCSNIISELDHPVFWIPGNHDDPEKAKKVFSKNKLFNYQKKLITKYWEFLFINTYLEGCDAGYVNKEELEFIDHHVKNSNQQKNICIIMHHHAMPVGTPLIDDVILRNNTLFIEKINVYPSIKLIICGHVHGDYSIKYGLVEIETGLATCFQWLKGTEKIETENYAGYTVYKMEKNNFRKLCFKVDT